MTDGIELKDIINSAFKARDEGNIKLAEKLCFTGLETDETNPMLLWLLASIEFSRGNPEKSIFLMREAAKRGSGNWKLLYEFGNMLCAVEQKKAAKTLWETALEIKPDYPEPIYSLALIEEETEKKIELFEKYLELKPDDAENSFILGCLYEETKNHENAEKWFRKALELAPDNAACLSNLGIILRRTGKTEEAIKCQRKVINIKPKDAYAHWNLSTALLVDGQLEEGFKEYEWRFKRTGKDNRIFHIPKWEGEDIKGKNILLASEQGAGDVIQFIRYVPFLTERGATVTVEALSGLAPIIETVKGVKNTIPYAHEQNIETLKEHSIDCYIHSMSLPHMFKTTLETIPAETPYISIPENSFVPSLKKTGKNIGIVWAGNPEHGDDFFRSCPLEKLAPLTELTNANIYSLQMGHGKKQLEESEFKDRIIDLSDSIKSYADTASIVSEMDLIITVDTSVAHIAGALKASAWIMLSYHNDWRFLKQRKDCPWYPNMLLFRQKKLGDWDFVVKNIVEKLKKEVLD